MSWQEFLKGAVGVVLILGFPSLLILRAVRIVLLKRIDFEQKQGLSGKEIEEVLKKDRIEASTLSGRDQGML